MDRKQHGNGETFDFERLIVYQKAMIFRRLANPVTQNPPRKSANTADHLDRSTDSVLLNIPEGNGYPQGSANRAKHFRYAKASANEAASAWTLLESKGHLGEEEYQQGRSLLLEVVRMLSKMLPP